VAVKFRLAVPKSCCTCKSWKKRYTQCAILWLGKVSLNVLVGIEYADGGGRVECDEWVAEVA